MDVTLIRADVKLINLFMYSSSMCSGWEYYKKGSANEMYFQRVEKETSFFLHSFFKNIFKNL